MKNVTIDTSNLSQGQALKLRLAQAKTKLGITHVLPVFLSFYPEYNNKKGKPKVQRVLNGEVANEEIILKVERMVDIIKNS